MTVQNGQFGKHHPPTVVGQEAAWTEIATNSLVQAKAEAQAVRIAYRNFLDHLERLRSLMRWMASDDAALSFQVACDNVGISTEAARTNITRFAPQVLVDYLTDPHAQCPMCRRPR